MSGIYQIENKLSNKVYIGQARDIWKRLKKGYLFKLPIGKCHNILLQRAWNLYGGENFEFSVLEICPVEELSQKETEWMKLKNSTDNKTGYNIKVVTQDGNLVSTNKVMSEEELKRRSAASSGEIILCMGKHIVLTLEKRSLNQR